jgi:hypothetical protein
MLLNRVDLGEDFANRALSANQRATMTKAIATTLSRISVVSCGRVGAGLDRDNC